MRTAISLFIGDEWRGTSVEGNLFAQASLLLERSVKSGAVTHGYCYTFDIAAFRIVDWYEL